MQLSELAHFLFLQVQHSLLTLIMDLGGKRITQLMLYIFPMTQHFEIHSFQNVMNIFKQWYGKQDIITNIFDCKIQNSSQVQNLFYILWNRQHHECIIPKEFSSLICNKCTVLHKDCPYKGLTICVWKLLKNFCFLLTFSRQIAGLDHRCLDQNPFQFINSHPTTNTTEWAIMKAS